MLLKPSKIRYTKSQRTGISVLIVLLVLVELGIWSVKSKKNDNQLAEIPQEIIALQNQIDSSETVKGFSPFNSLPKEIKDFNPNQLSETDWQNLGFSPKQVAVILKYKKSLGGQFSSKKELKECFVISEEKFRELEPYILLPEFSDTNSTRDDDFVSYSKKEKINYKKFNPNDYSKEEWMAIGFSEKQATTILKYKRSLGGQFTSLDQIQKCFVISDEKFAGMKPYIMLESEENLIKEKAIPPSPTSALEKFNPNDLTREQWMELGFTEKQVNTIFNYKKSLGGKFKDADTLKKCYSISEEKFSEIEPYLVFD